MTTLVMEQVMTVPLEEGTLKVSFAEEDRLASLIFDQVGSATGILSWERPAAGQVALKRFEVRGDLDNQVLCLLIDRLFGIEASACDRIFLERGHFPLIEDALVEWLRPLGDGFLLERAAFYQIRAFWLSHGQELGSEVWTRTGQVAHPRRRERPTGEVYRRYLPEFEQILSFRVVNPELDLETFHAWMNDPKIAEFWELAKPMPELAEYLDKILSDAHAYPLIGCFDGEPFGYFEIYWAAEDRLGPYYDVDPYDRGMHVLVGNRNFLGRKRTLSWLAALTHFMFLDEPRTRNVVGEPRSDNQAIIRYCQWLPYEQVKIFDFPHKRAALMRCPRLAFFEEVVL